MNVDANSSSLFLGNFPYRIDIFAQGREPTSFPLAVGTNATVRRSERTSRTDVQPGIAQAAWNQLTCSKIAQLSTRAGIRVATAISIRRGKLRHAPPRFHFRTDAALFARRDDCRFIHSRKIGIFRRTLTFPLRIVTNTGLRCSSKASLRLRRLRTQLVESCRIVTIYFLDVSAS